FGLNARKLQLFAEHFGQLLKRDIHFHGVLAFGIACLWLRFFGLALTDGRSRRSVALTDATALLSTELKPREIDLRDGNADVVFPLSADQLPLSDVLLQVLLDLAFHDLLKA